MLSSLRRVSEHADEVSRTRRRLSKLQDELDKVVHSMTKVEKHIDKARKKADIAGTVMSKIKHEQRKISEDINTAVKDLDEFRSSDPKDRPAKEKSEQEQGVKRSTLSQRLRTFHFGSQIGEEAQKAAQSRSSK